MKTIDASTVDKFEPNVGVSGAEFMSEDLQADFARNSAFQGYMWVPCFCRGIGQAGQGPVWFDVILPNAELEICIKSFESGTTGQMRFIAYRNGNSIGEYDFYRVFHAGYFYEGDNAVGSLLTIPKSGTSLKIKIYEPSSSIDMVPFTMFYRIVR